MAKLQPDYIQWVLTLNASNVQKELHQVAKASKELKEDNKDLKKKMLELTAAGKRESSEFHNLEEQLKKNNKAIGENNEKSKLLEKQLGRTDMTAAQLGRRIKSLKKELDNTAKSLQPERYKELQKELEQTQKAFKSATDRSGGLIASFMSLDKWRNIIAGGLMGLGAILAGKFLSQFRGAINTIIEFEKANSVLAGVLGTTKKEIADLTTDAKRLGEITEYTASQVTDLQTELAKLGFGKEQILDMTEPILRFATAVGTDLPNAAALAGATLRAFGLQSYETGRVVSAMAIGTNATALSFSYLESAMSTIAPVANSFGFTIEDTVSLLGALSNAGFDASSAATATRNILLNLADGSGKLALALGKPVTNLDDLVSGLKKLNSEGIDLNKTLELTDKRSVAAFNTFLQTADSLTEIRDAVTGAEAALDAMAEEMNNNVSGSIKILQSAIEGVILRFYESRGIIKDFIDLLTKIVSGVSQVIGFLSECKVTLYTLFSAQMAYLAIVKAIGVYTSFLTVATGKLTLATKLQTVATNAGKGATYLFAAAKLLLAGNIHKAKVALEAFNRVTSLNPYGFILAGIAALTVGIITYTKQTREAATVTNLLAKAEAEADAKVREEEMSIKSLVAAIHNQNLSNEQRIAKIAELKEIIPEYTAELTKEGKVLNENTNAIKEYIKYQKIKYRQDALKEKLPEMYKEQMELEDTILKKQKEIEKKKKEIEEGSQLSVVKSLERNIALRGLENALDRLERKKKKSDDDIEATEAKYQEYDQMKEESSKKTQKQIVEETSLIKKYEQERKRLLESLPEGNRAEIEEKNRQIEEIDKKIKELNNLGKEPKKKDKSGQYTSVIDAELKPLENAHQQKVLLLRKNKEEENQIEAKYNQDLAKEDIRFQEERIATLEKLKGKTKKTDKKTLDEIEKQTIESQVKILEAQRNHDNALLQELAYSRDKRLAVQDGLYNNNRTKIEQAYAEEEIDKYTHDMLMQQQEVNNAAAREKILTDYQEDVKALEVKTGQIKVEAVKEAGEKVNAAELATAKARAEQRKSLESMLSSFKKEFNVSKLPDDTSLELQALEASYKARMDWAKKTGEDTTELTKAYETAKQNITRDSERKMFDVKSKYGLDTWKGRLKFQLDALKREKDQGLISAEDYATAEKELKMRAWKEAFDYYSNLFGGAVSALQEAEVAQVEAKYDVMIEAAKGNAEETERLENEKAQAKLDIEKKYADVTFALKASEIIANTAVAIMAALKLGPVAGPIAAALMGITGAAQLATANAERKKVKNMTLNNASSSKAATTERVVAGSGFSEGGYTGDGGRYEVAGPVHRGEYVVPVPEMNDPKVRPAVQMIEAIRRQRTSANPLPGKGFAEGGYTGDPSWSGGRTGNMFQEIIQELATAVKTLREPAKNYVLLSDLNLATELQQRSEKPFTRGDKNKNGATN